MEGPKVKLVVFSRREPPTTCFGKEQGEICYHEVTRIGWFNSCSNAQRVQPSSAMGFSNYMYVLY